ncbi:MAG: cytochrome-c oxidase, cbb3-type subunit III [Magnetococcales bacterium]|nr:cytochrome-c oxidase, cbb3-type subunit III [Magnetococcales bacterium]
MADNKQVETTGHQWDDEEGFPLKEYNNPLPRWWLYSFYATIIWSVIYWILYPAWPLAQDYTKGLLGWSMHGQLQAELDQAEKLREPFLKQLAATPLDQVSKDPKLLQFARAGGKSIFGDNCAPCHRGGGEGGPGFPALVDDDWLYGGKLETLVETITNGRQGQMPAHLDTAGGALKGNQVDDLTQFVLSLSNKATDKDAAKRGEELFKGEAGCQTCHGEHGKGSLKDTVAGAAIDHGIGAPNLTDGIWLYGGDAKTIRESIAKGRSGQMPAWGESAVRKLDPVSIRQVALYVHTLGGGQ